MGRGRPWTDAEDEILRENIDPHGPWWDGWARLLPGRTPNAISARRKKLGIAGPRSNASGPAPWTDEQRIGLVEHARAVTKLTGHSLGECAVELARMVREHRSKKEVSR